MDYLYKFSDLTDEFENVSVLHQCKGQSYTVKAYVDDRSLIKTSAIEMPCILADIVDLASAIYTADWLSPAKRFNLREIQIILPLRNPQLFSAPDNMHQLRELLRWYTGDKWHFVFKPRKNSGRLAETQPRQLSWLTESAEVALWSGGLDSLAGLCGRILQQTSNLYSLVGSGSNLHIQGKQSELAYGLQQKHAEQIKLLQVPIQLRYPGKHPPTNDIFRSRGFVFKLIGAVCALMENQQTLYIYENGFGALNLSFQKFEGPLAHTRSVHPLSLLETGKFVSKIIGKAFKYDNPYLFSTKAQMCTAINHHFELAFSSISCDGRHRQADQPGQCGYCSSCLLRRVALLNTLEQDRTAYVTTCSHKVGQRVHVLHFNAMHQQVMKLGEILKSTEPWLGMMQRYPDLRKLIGRMSQESGTPELEIQNSLIQLYSNHVNEWMKVYEILQQSIIHPIPPLQLQQEA